MVDARRPRRWPRPSITTTCWNIGRRRASLWPPQGVGGPNFHFAKTRVSNKIPSGRCLWACSALCGDPPPRTRGRCALEAGLATVAPRGRHAQVGGWHRAASHRRSFSCPHCGAGALRQCFGRPASTCSLAPSPKAPLPSTTDYVNNALPCSTTAAAAAAAVGPLQLHRLDKHLVQRGVGERDHLEVRVYLRHLAKPLRARAARLHRVTQGPVVDAACPAALRHLRLLGGR